MGPQIKISNTGDLLIMTLYSLTNAVLLCQLVFMCDSGVCFNLTIKSYSSKIVIYVFFVLLFLVYSLFSGPVFIFCV